MSLRVVSPLTPAMHAGLSGNGAVLTKTICRSSFWTHPTAVVPDFDERE